MIPPAIGENGRMRVLFADDDYGTLVLGRRMLEAAGHRVDTAVDGEQALVSFRRDRPDIVLLDLRMPRLDGIAACRAIKAEADGRFIPVIFITSAGDEDLVRCLEAGGDGFLSKPLNPLTLNAQLQAFRRIRDLHSTVQEQSRSLREHQNRLLFERQLAASVFDRVLGGGRLQAPNLKCFMLPASRFAGDLILAAERPCGGVQLLLADFTGHGLPAAIGAIPVSDMFHAATAAGIDMQSFLRDLNERVATLLPPGMFLAATAVQVDADGETISTWNGGMPDALVVRGSQGIIHRFRSRQPPLGVMGRADFDCTLEQFRARAEDRLYLMSDGVTEGGGDADATYGEKRFCGHFSTALPPELRFESIEADVRRFHANRPPQDDLAVAELTCRPAPLEHRLPPLRQRLQFHFDAAALRGGQPLQLLLDGMSRDVAYAPIASHAAAVLCELFTNALEHGLLRLDSRLKRDAATFAAFEAESERRTRQLESGWIRVELEHRGEGCSQRLALRVSDSGPGFDYEAATAPVASPDQLSGRGLLMVRELASQVHYDPAANVIEAVLTWQCAAAEAA